LFGVGTKKCSKFPYFRQIFLAVKVDEFNVRKNIWDVWFSKKYIFETTEIFQHNQQYDDFMATATENLVTISKYSTTKTRLTTIYSCTELLSFDNALTFGNNHFIWQQRYQNPLRGLRRAKEG
jgi:hypothetical protein